MAVKGRSDCEELQNEKTLTFLYRAPKIEMKPLSIPLIMEKYQDIFDLSTDEALSMAAATMGYPFAFQVLGYLCWTKEKSWRDLLPLYDTYLEEYVYEKIWSELSPKDQAVLTAMSNAPSVKVEVIRNLLGMPSNSFTTYRARLIRKGLVISPAYGTLKFTLPRFREFVRRQVFLNGE